MKRVKVNFNFKSMALVLFALVLSSNVWGESTTYTFTSKSWADATSSWTSNSDAFGFDSSKGIQRTAGTCEGETKNSMSNITKIEIEASTTSKGIGTYTVYIGDTQVFR